ncbi:unnamed protein product, partial [Urochloa humidicola]
SRHAREEAGRRARGGAGSARGDEAAARHHPDGDGDPFPYNVNTLHRLLTGLEHSHFHGVDGLCRFTYCKLITFTSLD